MKAMYDKSKHDAFVSLIKRLSGVDDVITDWLGSAGIVKLAESIALKCWNAERPENGDTKELRRQLKFLKLRGHWDFNSYEWERGDEGKVSTHYYGVIKVKIGIAAREYMCDGFNCGNVISKGDLHGRSKDGSHVCLSCIKPLDYEE
jgi:hypothetical protein